MRKATLQRRGHLRGQVGWVLHADHPEAESKARAELARRGQGSGVRGQVSRVFDRLHQGLSGADHPLFSHALTV